MVAMTNDPFSIGDFEDDDEIPGSNADFPATPEEDAEDTSEIEEQESTSDGPEFFKEFEKDRVFWKERILEISGGMNRLDKIGNIQVDILSTRQILLEKISKLYQYLAKYNAVYKRQKRDLLIKYSVGYDVKLGQGEKVIMAEGDLAVIQERIDTISHQVDYYKDTIRTLDSLMFGVKNKIQIEQFLAGK